jgi:class 3 adenylate cyclase/pimeloyl-ACP methyl ester carboxylesterase
MEERLTRKLAAILYADVAGYSRLTGADEDATHRALSDYLDYIAATVASHGGQVMHYAGDAVLAMFPAVISAMSSAIAIQSELAERNLHVPEERKVQFRIGINLGDVIEDRGDIYGDGVNVAARLEALAQPGSICVSDAVRAAVGEKLDLAFDDMGEQKVKNISNPVRAWQVTNGRKPRSKITATEVHQEIRFCTSADGTDLAYAIGGEGAPLLKAAHFMTHLEHDWNSPTFGPFFRAMAERFQFVRYDQRGNGLSDRNPEDISFEMFVQDLEAIANAAGLERFPIYGLSQGASVAISYAVRHPERVSALILHGGFARGRLKRGKLSADLKSQTDAVITLIRTGWGQDNPAFRQMFSTMFIPGASSDRLDSFNEMMQVATEPDVAAHIFEVNTNIDVTNILAQVQAPTLILHARRDEVAPFDEGRRMAAAIPNATLVELDTPNHIVLHDEPAMPRLVEEIGKFLAEHPV